jgi:ribosomal peptide maturation radical SAM protein 1
MKLPLYSARTADGERGEGGSGSLDRGGFRLALVSMPLLSIARPSIQLGLLSAITAAHGFPTTTFHLNLDFAEQIGPPIQEQLGQFGKGLIGDWLFSAAAFGEEVPDADCLYLERHKAAVDALLEKLGKPLEYLLFLRNEEIPRYLDRMLEITPWERFRVVGFTSTFQQSVASFAFAGRLKRRFPSIQTVFGGSNFEGEVGKELTRALSCIDYAVTGEGDEALPELLIALHEGRDPAEVAGVVCRRAGALNEGRERPGLQRMDDLPIPDYQEFFDRSEALGLLPAGPRRLINIPFESARGCWWGEKHHCVFCGLNGGTMAYRAKSPERVLHELGVQARRYRSFQFVAVDNILDTAYLQSLFPRLIAEGADYQFFYEVKSNLTREQIKLLKNAGMRRFQPGIESLSTRVLTLMRKGVTGIQNVNTLRWSEYYGLTVGWNLLYGFPGETVEDYGRQLEILRRIVHLHPPYDSGRIRMDRYSPIYFDRKTFPARNVRPHSSYQYIYPERVNLERAAYFFDYEMDGTISDADFEETRLAIKEWKAVWDGPVKPSLSYYSAPGFLQIEDARDYSAPGTFTFTDPLASLYTACSDRPRTADKLRETLSLPWPAKEIEGALDEFCARGLMMREGSLFLSLALPATPGR